MQRRLESTDGSISVRGAVKTYQVERRAPGGWAKLLFGRLASAGGLETFRALDEVSLDVAPGEAVALVGENGSGKSTLLRAIAGATTLDAGQVRAPRLVASLIELGAGFHPDLTGWENIFLQGKLLGRSTAEIRARLDETRDFSGLGRFLDAPLKTYSSGMHARLGFAVSVCLDAEAVLIDEVLSVGDAEFQAKSFSKIREFQKRGKTIALVSHQLETVRELCSRAVWLERGRVVADGPAGEVLDRYRRRLFSGGQGKGAGQGAEAWGSLPGRIESVQWSAGDGGELRALAPARLSFVARGVDASGPEGARWRARISRADGALVSTLEGRLGPGLAKAWKACARFERLPVSCARAALEIEVEAGRKLLARTPESIEFTVVPEVAEVANQLAEIPSRWGVQDGGGSTRGLDKPIARRRAPSASDSR